VISERKAVNVAKGGRKRRDRSWGDLTAQGLGPPQLESRYTINNDAKPERKKQWGKVSLSGKGLSRGGKKCGSYRKNTAAQSRKAELEEKVVVNEFTAV